MSNLYIYSFIYYTVLLLLPSANIKSFMYPAPYEITLPKTLNTAKRMPYAETKI